MSKIFVLESDGSDEVWFYTKEECEAYFRKHGDPIATDDEDDLWEATIIEWELGKEKQYAKTHHIEFSRPCK